MIVHSKLIKKVTSNEESSSIEIQEQWIDAVRSHVDWLNKPDILTDYFLQLKIAKRRLL